jgi:2-keto-4-pentenoate hydratase/2-oxohepta-3-ene-1,7-dioic acid hydratase in catechol pathway
MKLASTLDARLHAVLDDRSVDLTDALGLRPGPGGPLLAFLEAGGTLADLHALDLDALPSHPLDPARLAAPVARPGKVVGAPVNYLDHKVEMGEQRTIADYGVFLKATSSVIGPNEAIRLPYTDLRTDHEGELGVVIGRTASRPSPVISTATRWPAAIGPTPAGVPVAMTSPGCSVMTWLV